jgi:myosin I
MASRKPALQKMASLVEAMDKNGNVFKGFHIWSNIAPAARKDPDLLFAKCLVLPGSTLVRII